MNSNSSVQNYFRTALHADIQQHVGVRHSFDLPGGILLWSSVGKVLLFFLPVILAANLWISSSLGTYRQNIGTEEQAIVQVESININLRAEKARLLAPENMQLAAAEKLSLSVPGPEQILHM